MATKVIQYPEGRLLARGTIKLQDTAPNPYGFVKASDIDPTYDNEQASLFILAVGRDGPPLAAKRYQLQNLNFPVVFEVTTDDLGMCIYCGL